METLVKHGCVQSTSRAQCSECTALTWDWRITASVEVILVILVTAAYVLRDLGRARVMDASESIELNEHE